MTLWDKVDPYIQEQTKLSAVFLLRRWVQNLRCLKHIVRQFMDVSFGGRLFQYSNKKLQVAYNDAFRQLLRESTWCSASRLFVYNNVPSLDAVVRKLVYYFWCWLCKSDNMLIQAVLYCDIFISHLFFKGGVVFYFKLLYSKYCMYVFISVVLYRLSRCHGPWACYWK